MADIKENFKKWLVSQGLSEKTPSGKPGTVYEYTRRINQLTDIIFKGHTLQHWELLARNIYSILGIHILCKNGKTFHSGKEIEEFLNTFLSEMSSYQNNLHDYFIIQIPIYKEDKVEYSTLPYELVKDLLPSLQNEVIILEISNSLSQISKNKNILIKFYKFLLDTQYCDTSCLGSNSPNDSSIVRKFYENLAIKIQEIESYLRNQIYALGVKIDGGDGRTPPLFVPLNSQETIVSSSWVCYLLRIERHTLSNLKTLKPTTSSSRWYSLSEVNDFIKNNFVPATETPADPIKIEPWWTVNEAIKNILLNFNDKVGILSEKEKKIIQENKPSSLNLSSLITIPDYLSKELDKMDKNYDFNVLEDIIKQKPIKDFLGDMTKMSYMVNIPLNKNKYLRSNTFNIINKLNGVQNG